MPFSPRVSTLIGLALTCTACKIPEQLRQADEWPAPEGEPVATYAYAVCEDPDQQPEKPSASREVDDATRYYLFERGGAKVLYEWDLDGADYFYAIENQWSKDELDLFFTVEKMGAGMKAGMMFMLPRDGSQGIVFGLANRGGMKLKWQKLGEHYAPTEDSSLLPLGCLSRVDEIYPPELKEPPPAVAAFTEQSKEALERAEAQRQLRAQRLAEQAGAGEPVEEAAEEPAPPTEEGAAEEAQAPDAPE